jgi:hypothetical protein
MGRDLAYSSGAAMDEVARQASAGGFACKSASVTHGYEAFHAPPCTFTRPRAPSRGHGARGFGEGFRVSVRDRIPSNMLFGTPAPRSALHAVASPGRGWDGALEGFDQAIRPRLAQEAADRGTRESAARATR